MGNKYFDYACAECIGWWYMIYITVMEWRLVAAGRGSWERSHPTLAQHWPQHWPNTNCWYSVLARFIWGSQSQEKPKKTKVLEVMLIFDNWSPILCHSGLSVWVASRQARDRRGTICRPGQAEIIKMALNIEGWSHQSGAAVRNKYTITWWG